MNDSLLRKYFFFSVIFIMSALFFSCKKDTPTQPIVENKLKAIIISKDSSLVLSREGTEIILDGSSSIDAKSFTWTRTNNDSFNIKDLGHNPVITDTLFDPGSYTYKLAINGVNGISDSSTFNLLALPAHRTNAIWAFYGTSGSTSNSKISLVTLNPDDFSQMTVVIDDINNKSISMESFSREPNGKRLLVASHSSLNPDLALFNVANSKVDILHPTHGVTMMGEWSPNGNWIAYCEDDRYPNGDKDEIAIINPNTGEQFYLSGETTNDYFVGWNPSWNPKCDKLAVGLTRDTTSSGKLIRRLQIYSNLFSGHPTRKRLHTDEYLVEYFSTHFGFTEEQALSIKEGVNGVAWSPDGELIAYNIQRGYLDIDWTNAVVIARADGSGIQSVLVDQSNINRMYWNPTWSPDGKYLMFTVWQQYSTIQDLYIVNRDGSNLRNISREYGYTKKFMNVCWGN